MIQSPSRHFALAALLIAPSITQAQVEISPALQEKTEAEVLPANKIVIEAQAQPDPMLRYRLWPEPALRKDGCTPTGSTTRPTASPRAAG
jgi:hypothetical protein